MARKKQENKNEGEVLEEEFNENEDNLEKEIDLGDGDDLDIDFEEGFLIETDEEISFTTKRAFDEDDEEDTSLDIAFYDEDPRDQY